MKTNKLTYVGIFILMPFFFRAQFAPPAGQAGSTAMFKDSSAFVNWAKSCTLSPGPQDIFTPSLGLASAGTASMVSAKADLVTASLGDGGWATCNFEFPVMNGPGYDFAVFENSFSDDFLELAFVEVSSDGLNFFRFHSSSLSDTLVQCGSFGLSDATRLNNLAGKYRGGYGVPFDLQELANTPGLNVNAITHIKIRDVVGSIHPNYGSRDGSGRIINDPWPTPFPSSGFDLDAIGVIHQNNPQALKKNEDQNLNFIVFPNPISASSLLKISISQEVESISVVNTAGEKMIQAKQTREISLEGLSPGLYFVHLESGAFKQVKRLLIIP